jgi:cellulose synthase/poly-beta-1,6-N-acetylglucosamine synthase-like glycosyltransferase
METFLGASSGRSPGAAAAEPSDFRHAASVEVVTPPRRSREVIALVPTYNEVAELPLAIAALRGQTRPPDHIIAVVNNPRDGIVDVARATGVECHVIDHCPDLKAGALNEVLDLLLPGLDDDDVVLVQDADSYLDPEFIERGLASYTDGVGGVGGVFRGRIDGPTRRRRTVQAFQANEYARYELDIRRRRGKVLVLTGTATLLRAGILREVIDARIDGRLPGKPQVYDTEVLTEDNELSFALMHLGYRIVSPRGCTLATETMPTWRTLAKQRLRWKRGALENLFQYGWTPATRSYWWRQLVGIVGVIASSAYIATMLVGFIAGIEWNPIWTVVGVLFSLERLVTVRRRGPRAMAVAALVVIETAYDLFLQAVQARVYVDVLFRRRKEW